MFPNIDNKNLYFELYERYSDYIDAFNSIFQINSNNEADIFDVFQKIKTILIEKYEISPINILDSIDKAFIHRKRFANSYWLLLEKIYSEYSEIITQQLKGDGYCLLYRFFLKRKAEDKSFDLSNFINDPIEEVIMADDLERFIKYSESSNFDKNLQFTQSLKEIFPYSVSVNLNLLEYCSMNGAQKIFKYLRSCFSFQISDLCYQLSFLGGDTFIINECKSCCNATINCLNYAIIAHNFDFVIFLENNFHFNINYSMCTHYYNLQAFLLSLNQSKDIYSAFYHSPHLLIKSLCQFLFENVKEIRFDLIKDTALHNATKGINLRPIQILLNIGMDINTRNKDGETALHYAVGTNNSEVIKYLVQNGADLKVKDNKGEAPIHVAADLNDENIIRYLIENGSDVNARNNADETPLHMAVSSNAMKSVQELVDHGAEIDPVSFYNQTPLHISVSYRYFEPAIFLINNGADVCRKDRNGWNIIHVAVSYKETSEDFIKFLLDHKADVNCLTNYNDTPLHIAASNSNSTFVKLLISCGANVNAKNCKDYTPLHIAAKYDSIDVARILIENGAEVNARNCSEFTPLYFATKDSDVYNYLISKNAIL